MDFGDFMYFCYQFVIFIVCDMVVFDKYCKVLFFFYVFYLFVMVVVMVKMIRFCFIQLLVEVVFQFVFYVVKFEMVNGIFEFGIFFDGMVFVIMLNCNNFFCYIIQLFWFVEVDNF